MLSRARWLYVVCSFCLAVTSVSAQEGQQGPPGQRAKPGDAPPPGVDRRYWVLTHSKDPKTKGLAERYLGLVKYQQWNDASGKFSTMAKYVSHESDLSKVKLAVPKGSGKDRTIKEVDVDVEKLSKQCQARVKQIDVLQKRLDELAAAEPPNPNEPGVPGAGPGGIGPEGQGGERVGYRGPGQGPEAPPVGPGGIPGQGPGAAQAAAPENDPSALEPDPLGFAELPPVAAAPGPGPGPGPGNAPNGLPGNEASILFPGARQAAKQLDRSQWRNDFDAFVANISVTSDPNGKQAINWGEMNELREMHELVATGQRGPEAPTVAQISERIGDLHWQIVVDQAASAPGGMVEVHFHPMTLPAPLELTVTLDEKEQPTAWAKVVPGSKVNVLGRLVISEPNKLSLKVRMAPTR